jgi:hypothetical protein
MACSTPGLNMCTQHLNPIDRPGLSCLCCRRTVPHPHTTPSRPRKGGRLQHLHARPQQPRQAAVAQQQQLQQEQQQPPHVQRHLLQVQGQV